MTVKTSISLTDDQDAYTRALVARGRYPSVSAVLQRGLEMLRRDDETHRAQIEALQVLIDRRRSEPSLPLEQSAEALLAAMDREE
jgi:antitoxin ParD1/3/4